MNEDQGFALHPFAARDIAEIWEYIAADSPFAARRVREEIYSALLAFPGVGHRRVDVTSRPLRFILVREYLIAYAPNEAPLWVIAVAHGRRSPCAAAAILRCTNVIP